MAPPKESDFWRAIPSRPKEIHEWSGRGSAFPKRTRRTLPALQSENEVYYRDGNEQLVNATTHHGHPQGILGDEACRTQNVEVLGRDSDERYRISLDSADTLAKEDQVTAELVEGNELVGQQKNSKADEARLKPIEPLILNTAVSKNGDLVLARKLCENLIQYTPSSSARSSTLDSGVWTPAESSGSSMRDRLEYTSSQDYFASGSAQRPIGGNLDDYVPYTPWDVVAPHRTIQNESSAERLSVTFNRSIPLTTTHEELEKERSRILIDLTETQDLLRYNAEDISIGQAHYALVYEHESLKEQESILISHLEELEETMGEVSHIGHRSSHDLSDSDKRSNLVQAGLFDTRSIALQTIPVNDRSSHQRNYHYRDFPNARPFFSLQSEAHPRIEPAYLLPMEVLAAKFDLENYNKQWSKAQASREYMLPSPESIPWPSTIPDLEHILDTEQKWQAIICQFFCVPFTIFPYSHLREEDEGEVLELEMAVSDTDEEKIDRLRALNDQLKLERTRWHEELWELSGDSDPVIERVKLICVAILELKIKVESDLDRILQNAAHPFH